MITKRPRRAARTARSGTHGEQRLRSILGVTVGGNGSVAALVDLAPADEPRLSPFPTIVYVDATVSSTASWSEGDLAIHVLWTAPGSDAVLRLGEQTSEDTIDYPCAPGDFLLVPPRVAFTIEAGMLAVVVGTHDLRTDAVDASPARPLLAPTHGLPVFAGYNRQTFGVATANLALCRWKLTHPQVVSAPPDRPLWLSNLVEPVAISWPGGTNLLSRTESLFLPPGGEVTVVPNDLGYVLTTWRPMLEREILPPLRSAGYTNAEIAQLGIPSEALVDQAG